MSDSGEDDIDGGFLPFFAPPVFPFFWGFGDSEEEDGFDYDNGYDYDDDDDGEWQQFKHDVDSFLESETSENILELHSEDMTREHSEYLLEKAQSLPSGYRLPENSRLSLRVYDGCKTPTIRSQFLSFLEKSKVHTMNFELSRPRERNKTNKLVLSKQMGGCLANSLTSLSFTQPVHQATHSEDELGVFFESLSRLLPWSAKKQNSVRELKVQFHYNGRLSTKKLKTALAGARKLESLSLVINNLPTGEDVDENEDLLNDISSPLKNCLALRKFRLVLDRQRDSSDFLVSLLHVHKMLKDVKISLEKPHDYQRIWSNCCYSKEVLEAVSSHQSLERLCLPWSSSNARKAQAFFQLFSQKDQLKELILPSITLDTHGSLPKVSVTDKWGDSELAYSLSAVPFIPGVEQLDIRLEQNGTLVPGNSDADDALQKLFRAKKCGVTTLRLFGLRDSGFQSLILALRNYKKLVNLEMSFHQPSPGIEGLLPKSNLKRVSLAFPGRDSRDAAAFLHQHQTIEYFNIQLPLNSPFLPMNLEMAELMGTVRDHSSLQTLVIGATNRLSRHFMEQLIDVLAHNPKLKMVDLSKTDASVNDLAVLVEGIPRFNCIKELLLPSGEVLLPGLGKALEQNSSIQRVHAEFPSVSAQKDPLVLESVLGNMLKDLQPSVWPVLMAKSCPADGSLATSTFAFLKKAVNGLVGMSSRKRPAS